MQDSSFHCLCEVCLFLRNDGNSYIALLQKEICVGVDLLGVDISSQGSPPPLSTPGPQIRWDETHDFSACANSSCSTAESWFQTYPEIQLESTASNDLMKAGFADPAAFGLPVRGLICQSPKDWFATRLVSLPRLSSLMRASAGTCTSTILQFCLAKKSTVTTHPQQCREENQGPCHCGTSLVSLGKYCKNPVTSRDYEHLNNAIGLFAPMAACCTSSVDMAISQTWQPKVPSLLWDVIAGVPSNPTVLLISLLPADAQLCIWNPAPALECFLPNISSTLCFPIRRALLRLVAHCLPCKESASWEAQPFPTKPTI